MATIRDVSRLMAEVVPLLAGKADRLINIVALEDGLGFRLITSSTRLRRGRGTTESSRHFGHSVLRSCGTP